MSAVIQFPNFPTLAPIKNGIARYTYCVIDLETRNCEPDVVTRVVEKKMAQWEPPSNYKDAAKIEALREEVRAKAGDKSATWDEAPIAIISMKSNTEFRLLHCCRAEPPRLVSGATVQGFATEKEMLLAFHALIDAAWILPNESDGRTLNEPTVITGHNVLGFDLPKLRLRSIANRVRIPAGLVAHLPVYDTMQKWKYFSRDQRPFVPFEEVVDALGLPQHKQIMNGGDAPRLIAEGRYEEVIAYALCEVVDGEQAYLLMNGRN